MRKKKSTKIIFFVFVILFGSASYSTIRYYDSYQEELKDKKIALIKNEISENILEKRTYPEEINILDERYRIEYTFRQDLTNFIKDLVSQYKPDHSAIIVMDNETGKILSAVGYSRHSGSLGQDILFKATHPSASLIKIVTSAKLLENPNIQDQTLFFYRGKSTTLYKSQLKPTVSRWDRMVTLKKAFASSNNAIFGKAAILNLSPRDIFEKARDFGFNADIMEEISLPRSRFNLPQNDYHLAELASGFNTETLISPIHGALLSQIVANNGILVRPKMVSKIIDEKESKDLWVNTISHRRILKPEVSEELQKMMEGTIESGTAKKSFKKMGDFFKKYLRIGGKTGTITGGIPYGKRDWFTAYAGPKDALKGKGISICVMNVNVNKWYVRSAFMARQIIDFYFKSINPIDQFKHKVARAPK